LSLLSLIGGAGFFIGLILGVVGGILALVFHPTEDMDDLFPGTTSGGVCRNCGARVPQGPRGYCPSCGHPFG
ncbi:MAG TPA: hypothetical protein VEY07_01410, partial [Thermoplasmata archaeon]|nr:hypothetical protein [Thermoplasmata archaeon]